MTKKQTYTKKYYATWSRTFSGSSYYSSAGSEMRQGYYKGAGDYRGMVGFDSAAIQSDLSGATVESCVVYLRAKHWYFGTGGTAIVGTHNNTNAPGTWTGVNANRWTSSGWPKPGGRRLNLGAAVGDEFKAGTTKGIVVGPAPSTSHTYYGKFDGDGANNEPYIEIRYVR